MHIITIVICNFVKENYFEGDKREILRELPLQGLLLLNMFKSNK